MADLSVDFAGIKAPNPFWLASAPPSNTGDQIARAFDAGWGGAVWKTIGQPIENTWSRYSAVDLNGQRMMGLNNIELITDRPLEVNLKEVEAVKRRYPDHAVVVSLMAGWYLHRTEHSVAPSRVLVICGAAILIADAAQGQHGRTPGTRAAMPPAASR